MDSVVVVLLGMGVSFMAVGCGEIEEVAESGDAGSSPPALARSTGELTDAERRFQGFWQLNEYGPDSRLGTLRIENRDFEADGVHGKYAGSVSIRADTSPAQVDFTIDECECGYEGMTSTGIYYVEDDGAIVFAGPAPGDPRPTGFTNTNEMWRMRPLDPADTQEVQ